MHWTRIGPTFLCTGWPRIGESMIATPGRNKKDQLKLFDNFFKSKKLPTGE